MPGGIRFPGSNSAPGEDDDNVLRGSGAWGKKKKIQTCGFLWDCFKALPFSKKSVSTQGFTVDYLVCVSLLLLTSVMMFEFTQTFTREHTFPFQLLFTGPTVHSQQGKRCFSSFPANVSTLLFLLRQGLRNCQLLAKIIWGLTFSGSCIKGC